MVYGIEIFKDYFEDYTGQYVFISGTACEILLDEMGADSMSPLDKIGIGKQRCLE